MKVHICESECVQVQIQGAEYMQVRSQEMEYEVCIWEAENMQVRMKVTECVQVQIYGGRMCAGSDQEAECVEVQNFKAECVLVQI